MSEQSSRHHADAWRWLLYARQDLAAAKLLLGSREEVVPRQACWLAQQAAEKALKAALVMAQVDFPKTHNLNVLRNLLPPASSARREPPDLAELTVWAIEARYPGDWPEATSAQAAVALQQAHTIVEAVQADLGSETESP
ncbi:MAG: HEPN domain-containing protein [Actinomycetota bacterium]